MNFGDDKYVIPIQVNIPIKFETIMDGDALIIRASISIPKNSYRYPNYPTDAQMMSAIVKGFEAIKIGGNYD